jgi:hypothetical protein
MYVDFYPLRRIWPIRFDVVSGPNALPNLLSPLLLTPLPNSLFHTTQANVLNLIFLQAR